MMDRIIIRWRGTEVTANGVLMSIYRDEDDITIHFKVKEEPSGAKMDEVGE